jgi:TonB family protein
MHIQRSGLSMNRFAFLCSISFAVLCDAHEPDAGTDTISLATLAIESPVLLEPIDAVYPAGAPENGLEAHVHLELVISELGRVESMKVIESGGEPFDTAVMNALKEAIFRPARLSGSPVRALVQYTHEFHVPHDVEDAGVLGIVNENLTKPQYATVVLARRPISAASSFSVREADFNLRPVASVQDILRVTPGLVVVQHAGGGKANQYFLRGFDADHGTDVSLNVDGVAINMVSHAHGQGYADTNFIIPEVIEKIEITKGPYFSNQSDFSTAGNINMVTKESFEHSSVSLGITGSPGFGIPGVRALAIASPKFETIQATFAAEVGQSNGPFERADNFNRFKLFNRLSVAPTSNSKLSLIHMSYGADWNGSGQIPARANVARFGNINPTEGGASARHQLALAYSVRPDEFSEIKALAYAGTYRFNLFSNFTLFLNNENQGDEIEQVDRRTFMGAKLSYRTVKNIASVRFDTTIGGDFRNDDIQNELWNTQARNQLSNVRKNDVHESIGALFVNEEISAWSWLRLNVGARADFISFAVDDRLNVANATAPTSGVGGTYQLSPKANVAVTALNMANAQLDFYVNYGHGFHSNDVRGVFSTPQVTPLSRAIGAEIGSRARLFNRWDLAATGWTLDLANETVWIGDEGTTEVSEPTSRSGLEFETRFELTSWLAADVDVTFTQSKLSSNTSANGGGLVLAPKQTWSGGVSARHELGPGIARAGLRFFGISDRPASDDGFLVAKGFTQFDFHLGYRHKWFDVALDIENLFNSNFRSAQFGTVTRLSNEPPIGSEVPSGFSCGANGRLAIAEMRSGFSGCEDVASTPALPFTMRLTAGILF